MDSGNTRINICNKALRHLKSEPISSISEQTESARVANLFYDCARKSALRACDWHFARVQRSLTLLGDINTALANPTDASKQDIIDQFTYTYLYPADCVRMVKVYCPQHAIFPEPYGDRHFARGAFDKFEIMRSPITDTLALGCNLESAKCHYTVDIKDESQFDDLFQDALGWQLADEMCLSLTADKELQQIVHAGATEVFERAARKNGGESTEVSPRESPYDQCREGGSDVENHAL